MVKGMILDDYDDKKQCQLLVINDDGSREVYSSSSNGFIKTKDLPAPASAIHTHSKISTKIRVGADILQFQNGILVGIVKEDSNAELSDGEIK